MKKHSLKKGAFTLAETLITLSIIGICAAMVVTTLTLINPSDKANLSLAKKATVNFSNATRQILMMHSKSRKMTGVYKEGLSGDFCENSQCMFDLLSQYLQVTERISSSNKPENLKGDTTGKLSDGIVFSVSFDPTCTLTAKVDDDGAGGATDNRIHVLPSEDSSAQNEPISVEGACGFIYYDTNGTAKPNTPGKDQFALPIFKTGARIPTISDQK